MMKTASSHILSLTPGFSRVKRSHCGHETVSTVFACGGKPLKRLRFTLPWNTRLKPGVNEMLDSFSQFIT
jgi:hypothetical protein